MTETLASRIRSAIDPGSGDTMTVDGWLRSIERAGLLVVEAPAKDAVSYETWMATVRECNEAKEEARRLREAAQSRPVTAGREEIASELARFFPGKQTLRNQAADAILALLNSNAEPANHATAERQPETVGDDRERMEAGSMKAIVTGDPASTHSTLPPQVLGTEWQPIETAPKDGRTFYAICAQDDFESSLHWALFWDVDHFQCVSGGFAIDSATHWMIPSTFPRADRGTGS